MFVQKVTVKEQPLQTAAERKPIRAAIFRPIAVFLLGFVVLWVFFFALQLAFPYLAAGSGLVNQAKYQDEANGVVFPRSTAVKKIAVFGNSTILAGLAAKHFDELAHADGLNTYTYNSGFPGVVKFVPQLKICVDSGNAPDVILLTQQWQIKPKSSIFRLPMTDQQLADTIFPFRYFIRDALLFAYTSRARGGLRAFYRKSQEKIAQMRQDHGYYFVFAGEQSRLLNESLPDDFHLADDQPTVPQFRVADPSSPELAELNAIVRAHNITCLYVPLPMRASKVGEAAPVDEAFQHVLESRTPCKLLGPYYYRYPNRDLIDEMHLNHIGARIYTEDLYRLVKPYLTRDGR